MGCRAWGDYPGCPAQCQWMMVRVLGRQVMLCNQAFHRITVGFIPCIEATRYYTPQATSPARPTDSCVIIVPGGRVPSLAPQSPHARLATPGRPSDLVRGKPHPTTPQSPPMPCTHLDSATASSMARQS